MDRRKARDLIDKLAGTLAGTNLDKVTFEEIRQCIIKQVN